MNIPKKVLEQHARNTQKAKELAAKYGLTGTRPVKPASKPVSKELNDAELNAMIRQFGDDIVESILQSHRRGQPLTVNQRRLLEKALGKERATNILKSQGTAPPRGTPTDPRFYNFADPDNPVTSKAYAASGAELVYKAKDTPVNKANDITAEDAKRITALAGRAANHSIGEKYLARLIEIYGLDETERFLLIASGSIEKSLSSRAPMYDPTYPGLNVPLTAQQRAEAIMEKTIKANSPYDGFWGRLNVPKKR